MSEYSQSNPHFQGEAPLDVKGPNQLQERKEKDLIKANLNDVNTLNKGGQG